MDVRQIYLMVSLALCSPGSDAYNRGSCDHNAASWQPEWLEQPRDDLLCSITACPELSPGYGKETEERDNCCTCQSCMSWEGAERNIIIEYVSVLGRSLIIPHKSPKSSDVYKVEHTNSDMTEIPSNICNWDNESNLADMYGVYFQNMNEFWENLVELNFTGNKIRKIPNINCLIRLDKIYLNNNNIESLSNSSFNNLSSLRVLNLEGNNMKSLDPMILTSPKLNLFFVYLGNNDLHKMDVSNMVSLRPFCIIDYAKNKMAELVNENNFKMDMNKTYGPGIVIFQDVLFKSWPNFKDLLQLDSWEQMGKLFSFGFNFKGIPLSCDCSLEPFLSLPESIVNDIWHNYKTSKCTFPPNYAGRLVADVPREEFVCNISQSQGCQSPECKCVDKPKENTLYIDCSNQNLDKMPDIPISNHSQFVSLNISGNRIQMIANMSYLSKLISLDISGNDLNEISDTVAKQLENCTKIDISDNPNLRSLPRPFQYREVCNTTMRSLVIKCDCDTSWLETWLVSGVCETQELFLCDIPDVGITSAKNFHVSDLDCLLNDFLYILGTTSAATLVTLIVGCVVSYSYRHELFIIYLRLRHSKRNAVLPYKYDVFVSFNENEEHVTKWVTKSLYPSLQESGYSTFITTKDLDYGTERNSGVVAAIQNSRNFLLILSEGYFNKGDDGMRSWTENEWKYGWYNFKQDRYKNIVLVNFDHVEPSDVGHLVMRAYVRVGCTVDFENYDRNIMYDIKTKLEQPISLDDIDTKYSENKNLKFSPINLFATSSRQFDDIE